jgi:hypothetical protein
MYSKNKHVHCQYDNGHREQPKEYASVSDEAVIDFIKHASNDNYKLIDLYRNIKRKFGEHMPINCLQLLIDNNVIRCHDASSISKSLSTNMYARFDIIAR